MMKNEKGSTLAEVMAAFVILLMASQLLLSGSAAARKMERRADEISNMADTLKEQLAEDSEYISGTLHLKIDENTELVTDGWLFQKEDRSEQGLEIQVIRIEERD
jgi:hypothetical protein